MAFKIAPIVNSVSNAIETANNKKVPRYLYHFTSAENFKKMQSDAFCFTSGNDRYLKKKSIFMIDINNYLKDWSRKILKRGMSLQELLLDEVTCDVYDLEGIVVLKIPTSKLNKQNLKIRSQDTFLKAAYAKDLNELSSKEVEHLQNGAPAIKSSLYKQRKCPIEYIYQEDIPIDSISVIGKLDADDVQRINKNKTCPGVDMKSVLMTLFKNTPEQKAIESHFSKII